MPQALAATTRDFDNGEDGLRQLQNCPDSPDSIDLIIYGVNMTGISGSKRALKLRRGHINEPILLCSGAQDDEIRLLVANDVVSILLSKPVSLGNLRKKLAALPHS